MGFRLRFLCPRPWSVVFLGLTGRVWGGMPWGGGGSITRNAGAYKSCWSKGNCMVPSLTFFKGL